MVLIGIKLYNTESRIQKFNVGDLIIHPKRYENDCYAGTSIIVEVFVAEKDRHYSIPPRSLRMKKQRTGEVYVKEEYGIYFGVERGFLTHVPSR